MLYNVKKFIDSQVVDLVGFILTDQTDVLLTVQITDSIKAKMPRELLDLYNELPEDHKFLGIELNQGNKKISSVEDGRLKVYIGDHENAVLLYIEGWQIQNILIKEGGPIYEKKYKGEVAYEGEVFTLKSVMDEYENQH